MNEPNSLASQVRSAAELERRVCVILVSREATVEEASAIAQALAATGRWDPVIHCTNASANARFKNSAQPYLARSSSLLPKGRAGAFARVLSLLRPVALGSPLGRLATLCWRLRSEMPRADKTLVGLGADILIVFDDRSIRPEMVWLHMARRRGIPSLVAPYASSSLESDALSRRGNSGFALNRGILGWARRAFVRRYPAHGAETPYGPMMFYPLWESLALAYYGLAVTRPWVLGGGECDVVAVLGPHDYRQAVEAGAPPHKVAVTGQATLDCLALTEPEKAIRRQEIRRRYQLALDRPLVVCSVPQWWEHGMLPKNVHDAFINVLFDRLAAYQVNTVLSFHPKANPENYRAAAELRNFVVADQPLSTLLFAADIFVSSWSSTLRWAAMLGIASINIGFMKISYRMFDDLPSMPCVEDGDQFDAVLRALAEDDDRRNALGASLCREAAAHGVVDGLACARIVAQADALAKNAERK